jgi:hypothetical protein
MTAFHFLRGPYLILFALAAILHILLAFFSPDPNGYVYDFYSDAIILLYENGQIPASDACWVCYHPPLLPILGAGLFHVVDWLGGGRDTQLFVVAFFLNILSLVFAVYSFAIYRHYRKIAELDLTLWALLLFLPVVFISAFSIEADILASTLIVAATWYFIQFLDKEQYADLLIAAVLVGLSAMTKYNGVIIAVYFGAILLARYLLQIDKQRLKQGLVYATVVFIVGGYPYVKNIIESGSPVVGNKAWNTGKNYYKNYDFTTFSINGVVDVFTDPRDAKLKHYPAYNSQVLTSHYGQLWTDFSFYTRAHRHGQWERDDIYKGKYMPVWLLWCLLIAGLVPVIAGAGGFIALVISREAPLLLGMFVLTVAIYIDWFLGHNWWMLKTKYLLYLLPLWLITINKTGSYFPARVMQAGLIPAVIFSAIYGFYFAVF